MICEQVTQVDIRKLAKKGAVPSLLDNPRTGKSVLVETEYTACHLGGKRVWFKCPECERRCAILYAVPHYACRKCHGLRHLVELKGLHDRAIARCIRFRMRFGLKEGGTIAPFPHKPKLMRWHTYLKARARDRQLRDIAFGLTAQVMRYQEHSKQDKSTGRFLTGNIG